MSESESTRAAAVFELKAIYPVLFDDVMRAEELFAGTPSDFANRNRVRAYFAYVEGVAYVMRQITAASLDGLDVLSDVDMDKLMDRKRKILPCGKVEFRQKFMEMGEGLRFTLSRYPVAHGINDYEPALGAGWNNMIAAIKIRNRVTHPKSAADLTLTLAEVACVDASRKWWYESVRSMHTACDQEDERRRQL